MWIKYIIIFFCLVLNGCATADWNNFMWGNPNGPTNYYIPSQQPQQYGAICEICNRPFAINADDLQKYPGVTCPYCQHPQEIHSAVNRYTYALQQQNNAKKQDIPNMFQMLNNNAQRTQEILSSNNNAYNNKLNLYNNLPYNGGGGSGCVWQWDCSSGTCTQVPLCKNTLGIVPIKPVGIPPIAPPLIKPINRLRVPPIGTSKCEMRYICGSSSSTCGWQQVCF